MQKTTHEKPCMSNNHRPQSQSRRRLLKWGCLSLPLITFGSGRLLAAGAKPAAKKAATRSVADRTALALQRFDEGFHCSQCVMEAFAGDFGIDQTLARKISHPLAGGSIPGGECGVIGSGYIILGLRYADGEAMDHEDPAAMLVFKKIKAYTDAFKKKHGALSCRDLLEVNVFTPEGREEAHENNVFETRCIPQIRDGIAILSSLL